MTDPIPQVYLNEAAKRSGYDSWEQVLDTVSAALRTCIPAHARTLLELGWKPPVDPVEQAGELNTAFVPERVMEMPFRAFLEAAELCAKNGFLVFIRPDEDNENGWVQQLYILPKSALLVDAALIALREGMGE